MVEGGGKGVEVSCGQRVGDLEVVGGQGLSIIWPQKFQFNRKTDCWHVVGIIAHIRSHCCQDFGCFILIFLFLLTFKVNINNPHDFKFSSHDMIILIESQPIIRQEQSIGNSTYLTIILFIVNVCEIRECVSINVLYLPVVPWKKFTYHLHLYSPRRFWDSNNMDVHWQQIAILKLCLSLSKHKTDNWFL